RVVAARRSKHTTVTNTASSEPLGRRGTARRSTAAGLPVVVPRGTGSLVRRPTRAMVFTVVLLLWVGVARSRGSWPRGGQLRSMRSRQPGIGDDASPGGRSRALTRGGADARARQDAGRPGPRRRAGLLHRHLHG